MKVTCPNCRARVRLTRDQVLVTHITPFSAPCRLSEKPLPKV